MMITINPKDKKESEKVKTFLKAVEIDFVENELENDWWNEISEAEKLSIEKGLEDIKNGNTVQHEEVMKLFAR